MPASAHNGLGNVLKVDDSHAAIQSMKCLWNILFYFLKKTIFSSLRLGIWDMFIIFQSIRDTILFVCNSTWLYFMFLPDIPSTPSPSWLLLPHPFTFDLSLDIPSTCCGKTSTIIVSVDFLGLVCWFTAFILFSATANTMRVHLHSQLLLVSSRWRSHPGDLPPQMDHVWEVCLHSTCVCHSFLSVVSGSEVNTAFIITCWQQEKKNTRQRWDETSPEEALNNIVSRWRDAVRWLILRQLFDGVMLAWRGNSCVPWDSQGF